MPNNEDTWLPTVQVFAVKHADGPICIETHTVGLSWRPGRWTTNRLPAGVSDWVAAGTLSSGRLIIGLCIFDHDGSGETPLSRDGSVPVEMRFCMHIWCCWHTALSNGPGKKSDMEAAPVHRSRWKIQAAQAVRVRTTVKKVSSFRPAAAGQWLTSCPGGRASIGGVAPCGYVACYHARGLRAGSQPHWLPPGARFHFGS